MTHEELLREFASLPPEAQRRVSDYINFLRERYGRSDATEEPKAADLTQECFVGMWQDRAEMQDSSTWVRDSREREWVKQGG